MITSRYPLMGTVVVLLILPAIACPFGPEPTPAAVQSAGKETAAPAAPAATGESPTQPNPAQTTRKAAVNNIEISILESMPVQVRVIARGDLPDGCSTISRVDQQLNGNTFSVSIFTERQPDALCTEALVPFEEVIPLDVENLPAGRYMVDVNGVRQPFNLSVDNTTQPVAGGWQEVHLPETGISFEVPADWVKIGQKWSQSGQPQLFVGVNWATTGGAWSPASMLPNNGKVVSRESVELGWGAGVRYRIEVRGPTGEVNAVEEHLIAPLDQNIAYDFFAGGPTAQDLDRLQDVYQHLLNTVSLEAAEAGELPPSCQPQPGTTRYVHNTDGYCLLYPANIPNLAAQPGLLTLSGPPVAQEPEPVAARLTIQTEALAGERTLNQVVDEATSQFDNGSLTRQPAILGGQPAQVVEGMDDTRQLFVIHNNTLFHLTLSPVGQAFAPLAPDVETLWETATTSFAFLE